MNTITESLIKALSIILSLDAELLGIIYLD